jgi:putative Mg2+ transporter-C (MgtC) family protein
MLFQVDSISLPASYWDILLRLTLGTGLGAVIGANREFRRKPAGFRTHALVGLGAALLTLIGLQMSGSSDELNALSRVVQGLITGIGFIGGGVILHRTVGPHPMAGEDDKEVHGLSTSAAIWVVAAAGVASGAGMWRSAATAIGLAFLLLVVGQRVDQAIRRGGRAQ